MLAWMTLTPSSDLGRHLARPLTFPPMAAEDAFGFVDPELVLHGCHLLPMFSQGKCHKDGVGLLKLARDSQDWKYYFVNQYEMLQTVKCF